MRITKNWKLLQKEEVSHVNEIKIAKMVYGTLMRADQRLKLCERNKLQKQPPEVFYIKSCS